MNFKDLRIAFVHWNPCVRVYKIAAALQKKGAQIDLICGKLVSQPQLKNFVNKIYYYEEDNDNLAKILEKNTWDIIHCHNEPNEPTVVALDHAHGAKVIFDCHDFTGLRQKLDSHQAEMERKCFEQTQGVVHVSEGMMAIAAERYQSAKAVVLPSYPLLFEIERTLMPKLPGNHVVYQGGLLDGGIIPYEYRDYLPYFQSLANAGVTVHAYPAYFKPNVLKTFIKLNEESKNFFLHDPLPYPQLLKEISQYQWGLAGFNTNDITDPDRIRFLNNALPNKLFDYIFAGVCPVAVNNNTAGDWVTKNKIGYHAKSDEDFLKIILNEKPIPPREDINFISMENNIAILEEFYQEILAA